MKSTIMGIDPGSRFAGYGVIEIQGETLVHKAHGVIVLEAPTFAGRLRELGESFAKVIAQHNPSALIIEKIFLGKNADSAFKLGHARGVIMFQGALHGAEIFEYATRSVKKGVTGNGGADKFQVQSVVQSLLKLTAIRGMDASDALAMACYHASQLNQKRILERAIS